LKLGKYDDTLVFIKKTLSGSLMPDEKLGINCLAYILKGDLEKRLGIIGTIGNGS
jgi:hypothetical protein